MSKVKEIKVCFGTGCYTKGAAKIVAEFEKRLGIKVGETTEDGEVSLGLIRCLGNCAQAPVAIVNGQIYNELTQEKVAKLISLFFADNSNLRD